MDKDRYARARIHLSTRKAERAMNAMAGRRVRILFTGRHVARGILMRGMRGAWEECNETGALVARFGKRPA